MAPTVFITGASGGIGQATARAFAKAGYRMAVCCHTRMEELTAFSRSLSETYHTDVYPFACDLSDPQAVSEVFAQAKEALGSIDVLINNAGISIVGLLNDLSNEDWNRILQTNLSSVFYCTKAVLPDMIHKKNGCIVNVSSVFGIYGASCEAAYSATKGAINAFSKSMAKELAPSNIRVNAVAFGAIDTQMNQNLTAEERATLEEEIPSGRYGTPEEAGAFLLQVAASPAYLTGQVLSFDGGWY